MEHKWLKNFDANGVWTKPTRVIKIRQNGMIVEHDLDEYAKKNGIELPDAKHSNKSKKQINTDIQVEEHADLEQPLDSGHTEEHGDGDSEGSE